MLPDGRCELVVQAQPGVRSIPMIIRRAALRRAAEPDNGWEQLCQQWGIIRIKYTPGSPGSPSCWRGGRWCLLPAACWSQCDDFTLLKVRLLWVEQQPLWHCDNVRLWLWHSSPQHQHCLLHLNFSQGQLGSSAQSELELQTFLGVAGRGGVTRPR